MDKKKKILPEIPPEEKIAQEKALIDAIVAKVKAAQEVFANYTQEQVDRIFQAAALAANNMRIPLAQMAVEETGMGVVEDKVIKNHYASEYICNKLPAWAWWKTRSSRIITPPSTSATNSCR